MNFPLTTCSAHCERRLFFYSSFFFFFVPYLTTDISLSNIRYCWKLETVDRLVNDFLVITFIAIQYVVMHAYRYNNVVWKWNMKYVLGLYGLDMLPSVAVLFKGWYKIIKNAIYDKIAFSLSAILPTAVGCSVCSVYWWNHSGSRIYIRLSRSLPEPYWDKCEYPKILVLFRTQGVVNNSVGCCYNWL